MRVDELLMLREQAAMLAALKMAKVEQWEGWKVAMFFCEHEPSIKDIRLGWLSVLGHRTDRGTGDGKSS